jgi:hypothetical protein
MYLLNMCVCIRAKEIVILCPPAYDAVLRFAQVRVTQPLENVQLRTKHERLIEQREYCTTVN